MPKITLKPHPEICPEGKVFDAPAGTSICDAMLAQHIHIEPVSYTHLTLPTICSV